MLEQAAPHYLLLTQTESICDRSNPSFRAGRWRFVLEAIGTEQRIEISETEPGVWGERLQLLAVVRGLEALEQSARVTLITPSQFVGKGIRQNLKIWRESHWQWERFGEMVPIKHVDLWQRIDQAMKFHQVDCRIWDFQQQDLTRWESISCDDSAAKTDEPMTRRTQKRSRPSRFDFQELATEHFTPIVQHRESDRINKITFEELQQARRSSGWNPAEHSVGGRSRNRTNRDKTCSEDWAEQPPRVIPQGHGRAFGHYRQQDLADFRYD